MDHNCRTEVEATGPGPLIMDSAIVETFVSSSPPCNCKCNGSTRKGIPYDWSFKCYRQQKGVEVYLLQLRHVLLRIKATVEEAEGRHITNQAMLWQLQVLREMMYKGCYLLDTFTYRILQEQGEIDQCGSQSFALSKFSSAKRFCFSNRRIGAIFQGHGVKDVQKMLGNMHSIIDDMAEFIIFLKSYPPIIREPYSKYLFMEKCMFGRQAEMEKIIRFLLQPEPPGANSLQVLPIIGPPRVGKSTLVEHVCYDERVHNHFSSIILCSGDPSAPEGSDVVKKQSHGSHGRSLIVMELAEDLVLGDRQWRKLYSSSHMPLGSKVIITSRTEDITKLGTTGAIRLKYLTQEAYWYFFKVMAFGSTDPEVDPELASIAMEIAAELDGSFLGGNVISGILRANQHAQFWRKILKLQRDYVQWHLLLFGEHPHTLLQKKQTAYVWSLSNNSLRLKVLCFQTHSPLIDVPKTTLFEFQARNPEVHRELEVLVWKSRIPPYHSYTMRCELEASQDTMAKKKRPHSTV
uniref:Disease resistance N-terminal domain-containing protein n=1 Tax=Setaria viridis TaxID=4556 RepID=A0A4U6UMT9_SETVI|nr:hypothetical protein SEVIR_5G302900v2 [Setaria viridis]